MEFDESNYTTFDPNLLVIGRINKNYAGYTKHLYYKSNERLTITTPEILIYKINKGNKPNQYSIKFLIESESDSNQKNLEIRQFTNFLYTINENIRRTIIGNTNHFNLVNKYHLGYFITINLPYGRKGPLYNMINHDNSVIKLEDLKVGDSCKLILELRNLWVICQNSGIKLDLKQLKLLQKNKN